MNDGREILNQSNAVQLTKVVRGAGCVFVARHLRISQRRGKTLGIAKRSVVGMNFKLSAPKNRTPKAWHVLNIRTVAAVDPNC